MSEVKDPATALKPKEAAELLGKTVGTLAVWRCHNVGPVYHKFGGSVMYYREDIDKFCEEGRAK